MLLLSELSQNAAPSPGGLAADTTFGPWLKPQKWVRDSDLLYGCYWNDDKHTALGFAVSRDGL